MENTGRARRDQSLKRQTAVLKKGASGDAEQGETMTTETHLMNGREFEKRRKPRWKNAKEASELSVGDFKIDLERRTAFVRGKKVELACEEFDLLVYLVSHPKRMVTTQTMLSTHWDDDRIHQTQFLQLLLSLRKRLEAAGAGLHYIRTESLVVYRFDPLG